jgi:hypothetical protein
MDVELIDYAQYLEWTPSQLMHALRVLTQNKVTEQTMIIFVRGPSHEYSRGGLYYTVTLKRFTSPDGVEIGIAYLPDADVLFLEDER